MKKQKTAKAVEVDDTLKRDIAEDNHLNTAGEWTTIGKETKSNVGATCSILCYIESVLNQTGSASERALLTMNQANAHQSLHEYLVWLAHLGKIYPFNMKQAIRLGDFIVTFVYSIGEGDEMGKMIYKVNIIEVAHFNPVKIRLDLTVSDL